MDLQLAPSPAELDLETITMCSRDCGTVAFCKGECRTCYEYRRRTGKARPDHLIVQLGERIQTRKFLASVPWL